MEDKIAQHASLLMREKNEIIDLFYKMFLLSKKPESLDDFRDIFENYVLVIKLMGDMHWQYSLKRKSEEQE